MTRTEAEALLQEGAAELGRRELLEFTGYTMPAFRPNWHHARIAAALDDVLAGTIKRLMVFMPPQNGKSELVSRRFPAYALGRRPDWQLIAASYNADLAKEMSRDVQQIVDGPRYQALFPGTRLATAKDVGEVRMAAQFDVRGRDGAYRAAGVGQGIAGKPMHLGLIDDPVKNRAEAESEAYRKMVWNWYVADFSARQTTDQTAIVLVQTRWHEDDLAGRLLRMARENPLADQWTVVSFPAVAELYGEEDFAQQPWLREAARYDPRQVGEALWPSRFSKTWLEAKRIGSGVYDWSALYQQRPVPAGGAMAKREWFKVGPPRTGVIRRVRSWDLAGTEPVHGQEPAWTVGTRLAQCADGMWVVEHVIRVRATANTVDQLMLNTARSDGRGVLVREWQDPGAAGKAVIAAHRRLLAGFDYGGVLASGEKSMQWRPFFVQAEGGNVTLVAAEWNREWLDELAQVPYGRFFDQADSVALGFNELAEVKERGPSAAVVLPGSQTVSGPARGDWRRQYFQR